MDDRAVRALSEAVGRSYSLTDPIGMGAGVVAEALEGAGYTVVPIRDPDLLRADTIRTVVGATTMAAVALPIGLTLSLVISVIHGLPSSAAIVMGVTELGGCYMIIRMNYVLRQFVKPGPRLQRRIRAERDRRIRAGLEEVARAAEAANRQRSELAGGLVQMARRFDPEQR